jgi:hypothetical protein
LIRNPEQSGFFCLALVDNNNYILKTPFLFISLFFACNLFYGQNTPKTDTIFSGKYDLDRIEYSKIYQLTNNIKSKCTTKEIVIEHKRSNGLDDNLEYSTLSLLDGFNKFSKSTIFSDYKYFIYTKFCYKCDFFDDITLFEFHFNEKSKSNVFKKKIEIIINDKEFFNYPKEKLFYYKVVNNDVCYLLISTMDNPNNEIFEELKRGIETIN